MEETKNKGLGKNILIGVLIFLLGLSLFYIGYDKFLKKDKIPEQEENNNSETNKENSNSETNKENDDENADLTELGNLIGLRHYDDFGIKLWFENYLHDMPMHYVDNNLTSYKVADLPDKEISMFVWRYIMKNGQENNQGREISVSSVNELLKDYLNLENYEVKELEKEDEPKEGQPWNIFGLNKVGDKYVASVIATEFSFSNYRVNNVKYDASTGDILVYFDSYSYEYWITKTGEGIATYKLKNTDSDVSKPYLVEVEYSKLK